jgi:hypothetical protein
VKLLQSVRGGHVGLLLPEDLGLLVPEHSPARRGPPRSRRRWLARPLLRQARTHHQACEQSSPHHPLCVQARGVLPRPARHTSCGRPRSGSSSPRRWTWRAPAA